MECGGPAGKPGGEEEKVKRNRICRGTAFLLAAVLLAGCGKGGKQEPEPAASAASGPVSVSEAVPEESAAGTTACTLDAAPGADIHAALFGCLAALGCPLRELRPVTIGLEDLFLRLTHDHRYEEVS